MENNRKICCNCKFYSNAKLYCNEHGTKQQSNYSCNYFQPKAAIDWEQRRYEIAKEIYAECILEYSSGDETRVQSGAWLAVTAADILIKELKKTSK